MNIGYRVRYGYEYQVQYGYRYVGKNGIPLQPKLQCNNKWSTVSPSHWHIQHHPAIVYPLRIRLSLVRIRPQAAIQIKKVTLGGALTTQILFQGKLNPQPIIQGIVKRVRIKGTILAEFPSQAIKNCISNNIRI